MNKSHYDCVKTWRATTKQRILNSLGDRCQICGYNKSPAALDLHHVDPTKKDTTIGKYLAHPVSWNTLITEVRKCVLLCANCHRELHAGCATLPDNYQRFDESYADYQANKRIARQNAIDEKKTPCPVCGELKYGWQVTCSRKCAAKHHTKIDWGSFDLEALLRSNPVYKAADIIGVSDAGLKKHLQKHRPELLVFTKRLKTFRS